MYFDPKREFNEPPLSLKKWGKVKIFFVISFLFVGSFFMWHYLLAENKEKQAENIEAQVEEKAPEEKEEEFVSYRISEGDIPAEVFAKYANFNANDTESLLLASKDIYDFTNLKIGQELQFIFRGKEKAQKIKYYLGTEKMVVAEKEGDTFKVDKEDIPYEVKEETIHIKIDEFFYKDAMDVGLSEPSILEVADVFSFDIDFMTEIREGDEAVVVYEKRTLKGEPAPDGNILAAKFINAGQEYFAYYFESEGEGSHYDSEGNELMRQFLRAPLSYRKITSGYTGARMHPITKTVSAHYQIDYAAPIGTPVVSTARGAVVSAGWEGGWGNIVRIRHDNGYTTHYGHLSAYGKGIKAGASVLQGQVVGYVGSTGWSTGPHLDYGMKLNGSPINPFSLKLPKGAPLEGEEREKFQVVKEKYNALLN